VIGFLTILGYSLYDTVVVFDKVRETPRARHDQDQRHLHPGGEPRGQPDPDPVAEHSLIALLPVAALLFSGILSGGAGVLQDLALALLVGIAVGTYSSIFIATPLLADLKEREPDMRDLSRKVRKSQADAAPAATASRCRTGSRRPRPASRPTPAPSPAGGTPRGPRNQPVRDKNRNRPSGKKR